MNRNSYRHCSRHNDSLFAYIRSSGFQGDFYTDTVHRTAYATDASAYREHPQAVACPKDISDIRILIDAARRYGCGLIPRAGGTSLAGQVVGNGLVADVSKYMTHILDFNPAEGWVQVEPGVILDELNRYLQPHGVFFAPETSTSNRCTVGGMVGNNSCGSHSLIYGSTRDHVIAVNTLLSDGSEAVFAPVPQDRWHEKTVADNMEGRIYKKIAEMLSNKTNRSEIRTQFPRPDIRRRNNGYALDSLIDTQPFGGKQPFNLSTLIVGSEGTLAFVTSAKLRVTPLPPPVKAVMCIHMSSVEEALQANLVALQHQPEAVELMDSVILECTKDNLLQQRNRFFVQGDPGAILIVEFAGNNETNIRNRADMLEQSMRNAGFGYYFPLICGSDVNKVWALRKAGLGLLSNMKGDAKPVSVIEDTAIAPEDMPAYIAEFKTILDKHGLNCVYHAHIATGELHLRPVLNLKNENDIRLFHVIAKETALLVKKYRGSLSGEHGDGRLRGEWIPLMYGDIVYQLFGEIKECFDPQRIFNPGKITDTPPMDSSLRYMKGNATFAPVFDYSATLGLLRAVESCNGSGDCRKRHTAGGVMCPSYMATHNETDSTRARANLLREYLIHPDDVSVSRRDMYGVLDLCLSCKGCKSECPSGVDMAKLKAEFLQHYYDHKGFIPLRAWIIAHINQFNRLGSFFPHLYHVCVNLRPLKRLAGFHPQRTIPGVYRQNFRRWAKHHLPALNAAIRLPVGQLYLFVDEFTDYQDVPVGVKTLLLLHYLGYRVEIAAHRESGRACISKGLLRKAQKIAGHNIRMLDACVTETMPLVGIEPSCILSFRDEYPELAPEDLRKAAKRLASNTFTIEEFIVREWKNGRITSDAFTDKPAKVFFHGHCQQKSLITTQATQDMLGIPSHYTVCELKTGCCGMAGAFGYEKEHYDLSMQIGELTLFPQVRTLPAESIVAAPGTSCRQHIAHGTGCKAVHPVETLYDALKSPVADDGVNRMYFKLAHDCLSGYGYQKK
ncbi:MAG: FAD-binding protein [Bacteroidales bacterium]|nr:FAD-binding protein [Bacteroidales bacterium]